ncbi:MAG: ribonuclease T, partial [Pseudomonadota bacterium]
PGTASFLDRHEWIKHGTCHKGEGGADEYFDDTLLVLDAINGSKIGAFFVDHIGAEVRTAEIQDLFDDVFGSGTGSRVQFQCAGDGHRTLIKELRIALVGEIAEGISVSDLLLAAQPVSAGCQRGFIDAAGLQ